VSCGSAGCFGASRAASLSELMRRADKTLYAAGASGRNRMVLRSSCQALTASVGTGRPAARIEGRFRRSL
jgi:hypothetical protein